MYMNFILQTKNVFIVNIKHKRNESVAWVNPFFAHSPGRTPTSEPHPPTQRQGATVELTPRSLDGEGVGVGGRWVHLELRSICTEHIVHEAAAAAAAAI